MSGMSLRIKRFGLFFGLSAGLAACGSVDTAMRNAPLVDLAPIEAKQTAPVAVPDVNIVRVSVTVPESLTVSEANRYLPPEDIVWREDPMGDRREQVRVIVQAALEQGAAAVNGTRPAVLQVQMLRFHALTEKARYSVGGKHSIHFYMRVVDAETGAVIVPSRLIKTGLRAFGGKEAIEAVARGETQKVRITAYLAALIAEELRKPVPVAPQPEQLAEAMIQ